MNKVCIVEDNELFKEALYNIISKHEDFIVIDAVDNVDTALSFYEEQEVDLIFIDAIIRGKNTAPIVKKIKENVPNTHIYIMSIQRQIPFMMDFLNLDIEEYLMPPLTFSKVSEVLKSYKTKHRGHSFGNVAEKLVETLKQGDVTLMEDVVDEAMEYIGEGSGIYVTEVPAVVDEVSRYVEMRSGNKIDLEAMFPIEQILTNNKEYWEFWLMDIMDYSLQRIAISNCDILDKVFATINDNLNELTRVEQIAKRGNVSEGHLNKKIREFMGVSTMDYIQRRKIRVAKKKIAFSGMKLGDIAYDLGYNESSYFSKVFKKYEGMTPIEYKKMH